MAADFVLAMGRVCISELGAVVPKLELKENSLRQLVAGHRSTQNFASHVQS